MQMDEIKPQGSIYDVIRRNIRRYRKAQGMTSAELAELAELAGLSHVFIRQIESEKTRYNFSVETFYTLGVGMDALAQEAGPK